MKGEETANVELQTNKIKNSKISVLILVLQTTAYWFKWDMHLTNVLLAMNGLCKDIVTQINQVRKRWFSIDSTDNKRKEHTSNL